MKKTCVIWILGIIFSICVRVEPALAAYVVPAASADKVSKIDFSKASEIDQTYKDEFKKCDDANTFHGYQLKGWRKCSGDKNNLRALLKFPDNTVFFEAKMSLDLDGSWKACEAAGPSDLCPTWYTWPDQQGRQSYLDSDRIPYIVIPIATFGNLNTSYRKEFRNKTGIGRGDFAIVIYNGKAIPAIVGDGGPVNKIGEASNAVFEAVGEDRCREKNSDGNCIRYRNGSLESGALYFVFAGSARSDITKATARELIRQEGLKRFKALEEAD